MAILIIFVVFFFIILIYLITCFFLSSTILYLNRQPVPKTPKDYGLDFEPIEYKSEDNVDIKGWLIPGEFNKIIIMTHVGGLTKYGSAVSYKNISKLYNKEIEFIKTAKHLHEQGYWVLMFDFRNHGESSKSPNGGKAAVGLEEYKDVVGALNYIHSRNDIKNFEIGFVSFCMGANSTIIALSKEPNAFQNVKCLMLIQPISMEVFVRTYAKRLGTAIGASLVLPMIKFFVKIRGKHPLEKMSPLEYTKDINIPTLYVQARNDPWTELSDILKFFELTPEPKEFFWIENTKHRFESYSYFQNNPQKMLEWLQKWL